MNHMILLFLFATSETLLKDVKIEFVSAYFTNLTAATYLNEDVKDIFFGIKRKCAKVKLLSFCLDRF